MSTPATSPKDIYLRLLSYAFQYKRFFVISFIGFALFAGMQTLLFKTLELFINLLSDKPTDWVEALPPGLIESAYILPVAVLVLSFFRGVGYYFGSFYIGRVGLNVVNALRKQVFDHMLFLPQSYFDKTSTGEQISLMIYNIEQVTSSVTRAVKILFEDGLFLIGLLIYLFYTNWMLTVVFFVATPVLSGLVYIAARYFRKVSKKIQLTVGRVSHITNESVQGIHTVKSYNAEQFESQRFHHAANENLRYSTKFERFNALQTPIMHFVIAIALSVIFFLILLIWPEGDSAGAVAFVSAAGATAKPVKQLSTITSIIQRGIAAAESVFNVLDQARETNTGENTLSNVKGKIHFNHIGFHYENGKQIFNDFDLTVMPGETVALVGQSGSGKTTLAGLLVRFYNEQKGHILIDDQSISSVTLKSLRDNISFVSQDPVIFDATVEDNICYGDEHIDAAKMQRALKNANAYDFVMAMEHGVKSEVGEGGSLLSGGQRQRIAIARALYKNSPILILDEATSALDNESERLIQDALHKLKEGRTTLVIAHRLSTIVDADNIVVMDEGNILEMGNHASLLAQKGAYASLYHAQSKS